MQLCVLELARGREMLTTPPPTLSPCLAWYFLLLFNVAFPWAQGYSQGECRLSQSPRSPQIQCACECVSVATGYWRSFPSSHLTNVPQPSQEHKNLARHFSCPPQPTGDYKLCAVTCRYLDARGGGQETPIKAP